MAYDMARRFLEAEIAPHYDSYEKNEIVDRSAWRKTGALRLGDQRSGAGGHCLVEQSRDQRSR